MADTNEFRLIPFYSKLTHEILVCFHSLLLNIVLGRV